MVPNPAASAANSQAPPRSAELETLRWGPADWVSVSLHIILLLRRRQNHTVLCFPQGHPSPSINSVSIWTIYASLLFLQVPFSLYLLLCEHQGPFAPTHLDRTPSPALLFWPQAEVTFATSEAAGVTSISLSPAGEGSLLRLDRPRSFPSGARSGLSASPSLAGVEGPLCVLYSPGEEKGSFAECLLPGNFTSQPSDAKVVGPKGSAQGKDHVE